MSEYDAGKLKDEYERLLPYKRPGKPWSRIRCTCRHWYSQHIKIVPGGGEDGCAMRCGCNWFKPADPKATR